MSIQDETFLLVKQIWELDFLQEYRELMHQLTYESDPERTLGKESRSNYGYVSRRQHNQAWGYILPKYHREEINREILMKIPVLDDKDMQLIEKVHLFIYELNRICVNRLFKGYDNVRKALIQYEHKQFDFKFSVDKYFAKSIFDNVINSVKETQSYASIINSIKLLDKIDTPRILGFNDYMTKKIEDTGINIVSTDLEEIFIGKSLQDIEPRYYKGLFSMFVLENQLLNTFQLLFQGFSLDKLNCLDQDVVYQINSSGSNMIGEYLDLHVQGWDVGPFYDLKDIVMVNLKDQIEVKGLASIHSKTTSMDEYSGNTVHYQLRLIDKEMNMYQNLLKSLERI